MEETGNLDLWRAAFDALPSRVFLLGPDLRIRDYNAAAARLLGEDRALVLRGRPGDALHCLHSRDAAAGCGGGPACQDCVIRSSVLESLRARRVVRRRARMELVAGGRSREIYALISAAPVPLAGETLALLVIEDLGELAEVEGLIPICAVCRKVRDGRETWVRVESYFKSRWDVDFSHGLCPECLDGERAKLRVAPGVEAEGSGGVL